MTRLRIEDFPPAMRAQIQRKLRELDPASQKVTVYAMAYRVGSRWMATAFSPNHKFMATAVKQMCCSTGKAAAQTIAGNPPARLVTATVDAD